MQLVLLLLAVMWVGAGVYYFRGRSDSQSVDSIGSFRRQLHILQRTGPSLIDPAHTLPRGIGSGPAPFGSRLALAPPLPAGPTVSARRRQTIKRRRDVFFGLVLGVVGSLFLGLIPGLRVMWMLSVVLVVALGAYMAVLVQLRNQAIERTMKVRYLPDTRRQPQPALLRRSATN